MVHAVPTPELLVSAQLPTVLHKLKQVLAATVSAPASNLNHCRDPVALGAKHLASQRVPERSKGPVISFCGVLTLISGPWGLCAPRGWQRPAAWGNKAEVGQHRTLATRTHSHARPNGVRLIAQMTTKRYERRALARAARPRAAWALPRQKFDNVLAGDSLVPPLHKLISLFTVIHLQLPSLPITCATSPRATTPAPSNLTPPSRPRPHPARCSPR